MRRRLWIAAALAALVSVSASIGALAASNLVKIAAHLNHNITFTLNGYSWTPTDANGKVLYPITYNNTTYLPVRAVSEAAGVRINWDGKTQTIHLETGPGAFPGSGAGNDPDASSVGRSRSNPAPIGTAVPFATDDFFVGRVTGTLQVEEVVRGNAAWAAIREADPRNKPAADGHEYLLVKIGVKVDSIEKPDARFAIDMYRFTLVSTDGKDYERPIVVEPEPRMDAKLYAGASHAGWAVFQVAAGDAGPLIAYGRHVDGSGGYWFRTN